jgi:hypothetical protein
MGNMTGLRLDVRQRKRDSSLVLYVIRIVYDDISTAVVMRSRIKYGGLGIISHVSKQSGEFYIKKLLKQADEILTMRSCVKAGI